MLEIAGTARWRQPFIWIALLALALALVGLGWRGPWEPDEGRYTNVALHMLASGDWLDPHRHPDVGHWTKPPLTYWVLAASMAVFGHTVFAARLPSALAYLLLVWMAARIARRLVPGGEQVAALVYATMLLPFASGQLITTDPFLAASQAVAMAGYVAARFEPRAARRGMLQMWAGFALAFLTKGPPGLLPLLAVLAYEGMQPRRDRLRQLLAPSGILLFALVALPWYVAAVIRHPGLLEYFLGQEVVARVASDDFGRNGQWYGWIKVYLPTLLLGSLPWTPWLWGWLRDLPGQWRSWRRDASARAQDPALLLALWVSLPLLVFCLARSRLPLYLLPLFLPLALLVARQRLAAGRPLPQGGWIALWALALMGLKLTAARLDTGRDAAAWARAIQARAPVAISEVNALDDAPRYGLHLALGVPVEQIALASTPSKSRFNPPYDQTLAEDLREPQQDQIWYTPQSHLPAVQAALERQGWQAEVLGAPYHGRVIFRVRPRQE